MPSRPARARSPDAGRSAWTANRAFRLGPIVTIIADTYAGVLPDARRAAEAAARRASPRRLPVITYNRTPGRPFDEQAEQAAAGIESGSSGSVIVAGVSLGATVALRLAADHPDLVAALHLHETPFHAKKHPNLETIRAVFRMQRTAKHGHPAEAVAGFVRWAYTRTDGASAYDEWPQQWRDVALTHPAGVLSDIGIATGESIRKSDLTRITMPTLCTAGTLTRRTTAI